MPPTSNRTQRNIEQTLTISLLCPYRRNCPKRVLTEHPIKSLFIPLPLDDFPLYQEPRMDHGRVDEVCASDRVFPVDERGRARGRRRRCCRLFRLDCGGGSCGFGYGYGRDGRARGDGLSLEVRPVRRWNRLTRENSPCLEKRQRGRRNRFQDRYPSNMLRVERRLTSSL